MSESLKRRLMEKLREVVDPELGFSVVDAGLIDEVSIEGHKVRIVYHLTAPFCPPIFALEIGRNLKRKALELPEVKEVEITLKGHIHAEEINERLKEE